MAPAMPSLRSRMRRCSQSQLMSSVPVLRQCACACRGLDQTVSHTVRSHHSGRNALHRSICVQRVHSRRCCVSQGRLQEGSMVSLMGGQQADGGAGNGGGSAATNGGEHLSLPGASAASAFQAVQPVQQSELPSLRLHRTWCLRPYASNEGLTNRLLCPCQSSYSQALDLCQSLPPHHPAAGSALRLVPP